MIIKILDQCLLLIKGERDRKTFIYFRLRSKKYVRS